MATDLRNRLLLWHKALAQLTGTLSLAYAREGLSKAALRDWETRLLAVAADIRVIHTGGSSSIDEATMSMLKSTGSTASLQQEGSPHEVAHSRHQRPNTKASKPGVGPVSTIAKPVQAGPKRTPIKATRKK